MQDKQDIQSKESQPLLSVIIPVYNLPVEMVMEAINSVVSLSLKESEREIIVIDDGSKESFVDSLGSLRDSVIYVRTRNNGPGPARNIGLRMATGKFIQFLDGDDMLMKRAYEHCIDQVRYGDVDLVMFDSTSSLKSVASGIFNFGETVSGSEFMLHNNIHGSVWSYVFRRSILGSLRFRNILCSEDEEFMPQLMLRVERMVATKAAAYFYRQRSGSLINNNDRKKQLQRFNDTLSVLVNLKNLAATQTLTDRQALMRRVAQLTMDYIYNLIVFSRSRSHVEKKLEELRKHGLFPLPDKDYTTKYKWFRRMTNSRMGLTVLCRTLPYLRS